MTRSLFRYHVDTPFALNAARSFLSTMSSSVPMTNRLINLHPTTYRSTTKFWQAYRWQPQLTLFTASECQNLLSNIVSSILRKKSSSIVRAIKRCSAQNASSNIRNRSTRLLIVPRKVSFWATFNLFITSWLFSEFLFRFLCSSGFGVNLNSKLAANSNSLNCLLCSRRHEEDGPRDDQWSWSIWKWDTS